MTQRPALTQTMEVGRRQLFILPTQAGWYFGLILIALFAIAIKFDNQAAFMMLFILVGLGVAIMHATHNNVIGLKLTLKEVDNAFVGDTVNVVFEVANETNRARQGVYLVLHGGHNACFDVPAHQSITVEIRVPAMQRGPLSLDPAVLTSQAPCGLLFCWTKRWHPDISSIIYPARINQLTDKQALSSGHEDEGAAQTEATLGDFRELRDYQPGDRLRDVHWPAFAKAQVLRTKLYEREAHDRRVFDYDQLPSSLKLEARLSQLSFWVHRANREGQEFALVLPNRTFSFDQGAAHLRECLSALALFEHTRERSGPKHGDDVVQNQSALSQISSPATG